MNLGLRIERWRLCIGVGLFLTAAFAAPAIGQSGAGKDLTKEEIFKKSQAAYASLVSYSDEGKTITTTSGLKATSEGKTFPIPNELVNTTSFTTKLARPNLYRITWEMSSSWPDGPPSRRSAVWSAGDGDFLDGGWGIVKQKDQEMALAGATGISSDAAGEIPAAFFGTKWANPFCCLARGLTRQADEKVGDVDCYVFAGGTKDLMRTIWIGKEDFLIRQVRTVTSAAYAKAALAQAEKLNASNPDELKGLPTLEPTGNTSIETHTSIVVNQKFSGADFVPDTAK